MGMYQTAYPAPVIPPFGGLAGKAQESNTEPPANTKSIDTATINPDNEGNELTAAKPDSNDYANLSTANIYDNEIKKLESYLKELDEKITSKQAEHDDNERAFNYWNNWTWTDHVYSAFHPNEAEKWKENAAEYERRFKRQQAELDDFKNLRLSTRKSIQDLNNKKMETLLSKKFQSEKYVEALNALKKIGVSSPYYIASNLSGISAPQVAQMPATQAITAAKTEQHKDEKSNSIKWIALLISLLKSFS